MKKNVVLSIGFVLVAIIAYQAYLLYQKDHPATTLLPTHNKKVGQPQITVEITPPTPTIPSSGSALQSSSHLSANPTQNQIDEDMKKVQQSLQDLFKTILSTKEVQEGLAEFKSQAQEGFKQMQQELQTLPQQLDNLTQQMQGDPFFGEIFQNLKTITAESFIDRGDYYLAAIPLKDGKDAKVNIKRQDHFLSISISSKYQSHTQSTNSTIHTQSSQSSHTLLHIPKDAQIEKIQTDYEDKNATLFIKIPKIHHQGK